MGFMKTEQEQIEKLAQLIGRIKDDCENCDCKSCEVNGEDCCCVHYICATFLVDAGYGDISEYKAEIERLKAETSNIRMETAKEILDMLYDIGIDKETLECCRIFDVNGVSLAKQICEKYGVEIEK